MENDKKEEIKKQLFDYQIEGVRFLLKQGKAILADEMGLGKTRQSIVAARHVGDGPIVVICPASLKINWKREISNLYKEDTICVIGGKNDVIDETAIWQIINYDNVSKHLISLRKLKPKIVILDEAHYIKNASAKRSKSAIEICQSVGRVYLLTGTMIMNRPAELFNLLKAIGHRLGENWYTFVSRYCGAFRRKNKYTGRDYLDVSGASNLTELRVMIKDTFLRREKKDVLDLPEKIISNVTIEMTDEWQRKYNNSWNDYMEFLYKSPTLKNEISKCCKVDVIKGEDIKCSQCNKKCEITSELDDKMMSQHLIELQKLKQVCSLAKVQPIVEETINMIESGEKVVIFTQYTKTLDTLKDELKKYGVVSVSGEDNQWDRQRSIDSFQNEKEVNVFVGNMKAAGVGITLTTASKVIFADLEWTPAIHSQAEDRCHRIGQGNLVNVYYYIAQETIEEDILELLDKKSQIIKEIMEGSSKEEIPIDDMTESFLAEFDGEELVEKMKERENIKNFSVAAQLIKRLKIK